MPFRMVRWLWFGRPVPGLSGGSNGSKRRHCASVKSLRLTRATWALRAGLVPLCRHAVGGLRSEPVDDLAAGRLPDPLTGADMAEHLVEMPDAPGLADDPGMQVQDHHPPGRRAVSIEPPETCRLPLSVTGWCPMSR